MPMCSVQSFIACPLHTTVMAAYRCGHGCAVPGKYSIEVDGDFVVFVIGIYRHPGAWLWQCRKFFRTSFAMLSMIR